MLRKCSLAVLFLAAAAVCGRSAIAGPMLIDDFSTTQSVEAGPGQTKFDTATGGGILGGERDVVLTHKSGPVTKVNLDVGAGLKFYGEGSNDGEVSLTYDGLDADGDPGEVLTTTGLGGADIYAGVGSGIVFEGLDNKTAASTDVTGRVTAYDGSGALIGTRAFLIVDDFLGDGFIGFDTFSFEAGKSETSFMSVGALVFEFDLNPLTGTDFTLDAIRTRATTPSDGPLPTPEPASIALFSIGAFALLGFCMIRRRKERLAGMVA